MTMTAAHDATDMCTATQMCTAMSMSHAPQVQALLADFQNMAPLDADADPRSAMAWLTAVADLARDCAGQQEEEDEDEEDDNEDEDKDAPSTATRVRAALGQPTMTKLVQQVATLAHQVSTPSTSVDHARALLRCIANLVAECDENRARFLEAPSCQLALEQLCMMITGVDLSSMTSIACVNLSMDYTPAQECLIAAGAVRAVVERVRDNVANVHPAHFMLLSNLLEQEAAVVEVASLCFVEWLVQNLDHMSDMEQGVDVLETLVTKEAHAQDLFNATTIDTLIAWIGRRASSKDDIDDTDACTLTHRVAIVVAILASVDVLLPLFMHDKLIADVRERWLEAAVDQNVRAAAVLTLGNIGRSGRVKESTCIMLGERGVIEQLVGHLKSSLDNVSLQSSILSTLKNLSIPAPNRELMTRLDVMSAVAPAVERSAIPELQMSAIGIIKSLTRSSDAARDNFINTGLLNTVIEAIRGGDHEGMCAEGARLLATLARSPVLSHKCAIVDAGGVPLMVKHMLQSRHTVLQAECVLALTLLAAKPERLLQECLEADTVISEAVADVLGTLLEDEHVPLELKSNVCVLLVELLSQQQEHDVFWKRRTQWEASLTKLEEVHGLGVGGLDNAQKALRDVIARM